MIHKHADIIQNHVSKKKKSNYSIKVTDIFTNQHWKIIIISAHSICIRSKTRHINSAETIFYTAKQAQRRFPPIKMANRNAHKSTDENTNQNLNNIKKKNTKDRQTGEQRFTVMKSAPPPLALRKRANLQNGKAQVQLEVHKCANICICIQKWASVVGKKRDWLKTVAAANDTSRQMTDPIGRWKTRWLLWRERDYAAVLMWDCVLNCILNFSF